MITSETVTLNASTYVQVSTDDTAFFSLYNNQGYTLHVKYTTAASPAPTGKEGAIKLLQGQTMQRGSIIGYCWVLGQVAAQTASITQ